MQLRVYLPTNSIGIFNIADGDLVYDGSEFILPQNAKYIELYDVPVNALSLEYKNVVEMLTVSQVISACVIDYLPVSVPATDPQVIVEPNPSSSCVCGITCNGMNLSYVKVTVELS